MARILRYSLCMSGKRRKQKPTQSETTKGLDHVELPPMAHAIAQVAILAGLAGEVAALLTGDTKFLVAGVDGYATLSGTATSAAHEESKESKSWEDGTKRSECSGHTKIEETESPDGELSSLMKEVAERLSATRQKRRQKKE